MGTHRKTRTAKLNRTVTVGAVAGATAIGFGALSSMTAPTANADWWILSDILNDNGNDNGHNRAVTDNNTLIAAIERQRQCQPADVGCGQQHQQPVESVQPRYRWRSRQCQCDSRCRWKQHRRLTFRLRQPTATTPP